MAFTLKTLENHSGSGAGVKVFSYSTADAKATVKGANYFDAGAGLFEVGSRLMIHASDADFDAHVVSISAANVVVVAAIDAFA